jgi:hypothetical protein
MSRRILSLSLALGALIAALAVFSISPASVSAAPGLSVAPWSEDSHQRVNVRGTDFGRNAVITASVVVPGGRRIALPNIQADASGNFWSSFSVYHDLRLVNVGIYWAQYCISGTSSCWNVSFKIG